MDSFVSENSVSLFQTIWYMELRVDIDYDQIPHGRQAKWRYISSCTTPSPFNPPNPRCRLPITIGMQLVVILLFNYPLSKHTLQLSCPIHQYPTKEKFYLVFFCYWDQIKQIILLPMSTSEQDRIIFYICSHQTIACMNKVKFLTILVATLFSCVLMNAQQLSWKRYTVNDGLIQSQTNTVY